PMPAPRAFLALLASLLWATLARGQSTDCVSAHESAQRLRRDGHFIDARQQLLQCAQTDCPRIVRNDCAGWLGEVEAATPSLVFAVASHDGGDLVDVRVTANGSTLAEQLDGRAIEVDPGVYKLRFEAAGHAPREQTINVREAEKSRFVRVELAALPTTPTAAPRVPITAPSTRPARVWPASSIALGGLALAAGGTALGFGIWGKHEHDAVDDRCGRARACDEHDVAAGKRAYVIADVFASAAAAGMVGALWILVHANRNETRRSIAFSVMPAREGLRVSWSRAF
ncbi:MAG TPA: hypothetical protein VI299_21595, partial [Polyangiales bacterium]